MAILDLMRRTKLSIYIIKNALVAIKMNKTVNFVFNFQKWILNNSKHKTQDFILLATLELKAF